MTEFASRYGQGRALPRWLTWGGWPFVAFACVTIYGQMISVYQYPKPVLVVLVFGIVTDYTIATDQKC